MRFNIGEPPWGSERIGTKFALLPKRVFDRSAGNFVTIWLEYYQCKQFLSYMYKSWIDYTEEYDAFIN